MMVVSNVLHDDSCIYNTKTTSTCQNATGPLIYNDPKSEPYSDVLQSQSWIYMGTGQQTNISPFVVLTIIGYQILIHTHIPDAPWSTYRIFTVPRDPNFVFSKILHPPNYTELYPSHTSFQKIFGIHRELRHLGHFFKCTLW